MGEEMEADKWKLQSFELKKKNCQLDVKQENDV